jgi:SAM-dependent methyltransferase
MTDYVDVNRANWDDRVPIHVASDFYDVEGWVARRPGPRPWETEVLGDVSGLDAVHLQCHFGLDTLALANAGARSVTGLDVSPAAVDQARSLAARLGHDDRARFVEHDVLHALDVLPAAAFDLVYVSLGALCWLPSVDAWAAQVAGLLRPGGRLYLHDGHPLAWALAEDDVRLEHTYFEEPAPFVDEMDVTYTDGAGRLAHPKAYEWNHGLAETVTAVLGHGLVLNLLVEHDWTVWPRFPWLVALGDGRWGVPPDRPRLPLTFSLLATKPPT